MYRTTELSNNLRVVSHDIQSRDSVALGVWVAAGGRYENDQNKGAAHFLEHILFKGSKKYSCQEIKILIEGVGGSLNAFTDEEFTCYYAKIPCKHLNKTFDILSDMVLNPLITQEDIDKERTVILEEIKMYHDLPQHFVLELLDALMWPDHPLGKNIIGNAGTISRMTQEDLRAFHKTHYSPSHMVVSACGHFRHDNLVDLVRTKSARFKTGEPSHFLKANNSQAKTQAKFFRKDIEQMHLALGAYGLEYEHKDKEAYHLLNVILGGNMSSRLFDEVREKRGLAYSISSSVKSLRDSGLFLVRAGVDSQKIVMAVDVILKELAKVRKTDITKKELMRAKDYFLGQILLGLEDTLDHMFWLGEATVSINRTRTLKEIVTKVKKVTVDDIKRVADNIFKDNNMNLSIVGPLIDQQEKDLRDFLKIS